MPPRVGSRRGTLGTAPCYHGRNGTAGPAGYRVVQYEASEEGSRVHTGSSDAPDRPRSGSSGSSDTPGASGLGQSPRESGSRWLTVPGLILLCWLVWGGLLSAEFANDDELLILNNLFVRDFTHLWENLSRDYFYNSQGSSIGYWRPLTKLTYMVEWAAWGDRAAGYYALNVALLTLVTLLAYATLRRLGATPWLAFGVAALAAVHPAHAESVGIVTSRSDPLAAAFLLAVLFVEARSGVASTGEIPGAFRRALGLSFATLAIASKEIGVIAPVLVGVLHLAGLRRGFRASVSAALPYLVPVAVYAILRSLLDIPPHAGVHAETATWPLVLATGKAAGIYIARLFTPFLVEPITGPAVFPSGPDAATLGWGGLALLGVMAGLAACRFGRGRPHLLALGLIALPLAPALSLRYVSISVHADRLPVFDRGLILPSLGAAWLVMGALYRLHRELTERGIPRFASPVAMAWIGVFAAGAYDNVLDSQTPATRAAAFIEGTGAGPAEELPLFQRTVLMEEEGIRLAQEGDLEGAERTFKELIELDPTNAAGRGNLAMLYRMTGRPELAIEQLRWVLEYDGTTRTARDRQRILIQLAQAYAESGNSTKAEEVMAEARKLESGE